MIQRINSEIQELDIVTLAHDISEHQLKQGDRGAVVHRYQDGKAFEVEFVDPEGETVALLTLTHADIRKSESSNHLVNSPSQPMSDSSKVQMNFHAPIENAVGNVEGDMIINASPPQDKEATTAISSLLNNLRQKYPNVADDEIYGILLRGFQAMPQRNPQNWKRWQDILSVFFSGGIEAAKVLVPVAGIPIEVLKRLYEIYDRNRKQIPGG